MTTQDTSLIDAIRRWIVVAKKIHKLVNPNHMPNTYEGLAKLKAELEAEEERRNKINQMREAIKHLQKKKKQRQYWNKIERRRKIRKFLHLPYKTLNEDDFMRDPAA